jgi:serine/threonine protein kinase
MSTAAAEGVSVEKPSHVLFVCYSSADKVTADKVCALLELADIGCWIVPRNVIAGRSHNRQITEAIRRAQALLLILSAESNRSEEVLREVERAKHFQLPVIAFRIEKVEPSDDLAYFLWADHQIDAFSGPPDSYYPVLVRQVIGILQTKRSQESKSARSEIYGNFRILRHPDGSLFRLGKGGMGVTWKAIDLNLNRHVALKVIGCGLLGSSQARNRFLREAQAAAKIHHPHVATILQFGQEGDAYFYAMEFVDGEDLERYVANHGPLSPALALRVALQVAQALEAAQVHNLIHRDIKPANLMATVNRSGGLDMKLIDFGLAKGVNADDVDSIRITRSQDFIGSPAFASPEQCEMAELDTRSDIYSLGVTLWYLLTGKHPFTGTVGRVMIAQATRPPPFHEISQLPEPILKILRRMLAKEPADRPQNAQQLQLELEAALAELSGEFGSRQELRGVVSNPLVKTAYTNANSGASPTIDSPLFDLYLEAFDTGTLVADRYQLIREEREGVGGRFFLAQDKRADHDQPAQVGLKVLHPEVVANASILDLVENELGLIRESPHANLVRYIHLESCYQYPFLIREWLHGFLLYDLLRWRGSLRAAEVRILLEPLAAALDFVSEKGLGLVEISARKIFVGCPEDLHPNHFADFVRRQPCAWNKCWLKLNPMSLAPLLYRNRSNRSHQTLMPTSQVMPLTQVETGIQGTKAVRLFGRLIYELLSGHAPFEQQDPSKYAPIPELDETGNLTLRNGYRPRERSADFGSCQEFWNALLPSLETARSAWPESVEHMTPKPSMPFQPSAPVLLPQAPSHKGKSRRSALLAVAFLLAHSSSDPLFILAFVLCRKRQTSRRARNQSSLLLPLQTRQRP